MIGTTGIVLAGGRSTRFGTDKLAARLDGRTLLDHAVEALAASCDDIVVVLALGGAASEFPATRVPIRFVHDPLPDGGPLVGLIAGLEAATTTHAIVIGGDMPRLAPDVLALLVAEVTAGTAAASLEHGSRRQPLPCAIDCERALPIARALLAAGRSSLAGLLDALDAVVVPAAAWRALDPAGETLVDVDRPADLARLNRRGGPRR